jgi:hypothetical protein
MYCPAGKASTYRIQDPKLLVTDTDKNLVFKKLRIRESVNKSLFVNVYLAGKSVLATLLLIALPVRYF